jgi:hypothetical protein
MVAHEAAQLAAPGQEISHFRAVSRFERFCSFVIHTQHSG